MHPEDPDQTGQVPAQQAKRELLRQQGTLNRRPEAVQYPLFQTSDFFDAQDLIQVKYEMLRRVEIDKASVSQAAGEFGFSRLRSIRPSRHFRAGA